MQADSWFKLNKVWLRILILNVMCMNMSFTLCMISEHHKSTISSMVCMYVWLLCKDTSQGTFVIIQSLGLKSIKIVFADAFTVWALASLLRDIWGERRLGGDMNYEHKCQVHSCRGASSPGASLSTSVKRWAEMMPALLNSHNGSVPHSQEPYKKVHQA